MSVQSTCYETSEEGTGETVLVVDDLSAAVELMCAMLDDRYEVRRASNGGEALELLDEDVSVVLLDRMMPGLSGYEVVEEIRARNYDVAIAITSASEPDFDVADVDLDEYLTKPVGMDQVNSAVERLVEKRELDERQREYEAVKAKLDALEENKSPSMLQGNEKYDALVRRLQELDGDGGAT